MQRLRRHLCELVQAVRLPRQLKEASLEQLTDALQALVLQVPLSDVDDGKDVVVHAHNRSEVGRLYAHLYA